MHHRHRISSGHDPSEIAHSLALRVFCGQPSHCLEAGKKFIGMPREGVVAFNDAKGHMGPPKFGAASYPYKGGRLDLKIQVNYL